MDQNRQLLLIQLLHVKKTHLKISSDIQSATRPANPFNASNSSNNAPSIGFQGRGSVTPANNTNTTTTAPRPYTPPQKTTLPPAPANPPPSSLFLIISISNFKKLNPLSFRKHSNKMKMNGEVNQSSSQSQKLIVITLAT